MKSIYEFIVKNKLRIRNTKPIFTDGEIENIHKRALNYQGVVIGILDDTMTRTAWKSYELSYKKDMVNDLIKFIDSIGFKDINVKKLLFTYDWYSGQDIFKIFSPAAPGASVGYFEYVGDVGAYALTTSCNKIFGTTIHDETDPEDIKNILKKL